MSNPRFWEETPADDGGDTTDHAAPRFSKDAPVSLGRESAIDPENGEWKPTHLLEEFEIGGHSFRWMEGPIAEALVHDEQGNHLGTVQVPFDPADGEPGDEELEDAIRTFHSLEYIRGIVQPDAIADMVATFHERRADGDRPIAEIFVSTIGKTIADGVHIGITSEGGDALIADLTPGQIDALEVEVNRLFAETAPDLVQAVADIPNEQGVNFWQQMAQDIIAHAMMYARDEAIEEYGGTEAVAALGDAGGDAFEKRALELYRTGPYLAGAYMQGWQGWLPLLGEITYTALRETLGDSEETTNKELLDRIVRKARKNLGYPDMPSMGDGTPPAMFQQSLFGDGGYGWGHNSPIVIAGRHMFTAPKTAWELDMDGWPIYQWGNAGGRAAYTPSRGDLETIAAAFEMVRRYSLKHQMLFHYLIVKHLTHATDGSHRPYGMFEFSVDEYLKTRKIKKHKSGGYATDDRREVVNLLYDLARTEVKGTAYAKKGRKKEPQPVDVYSKLILISSRVEGDDYRFAMRGGDFMYQIEAAGNQYALTTRALLQLDQKNDMNAIKLGHFIQEIFRIRSRSDNMSRPIRVANLLEEAEIEVDRANAGRFLERIERALNTLCDPMAMDGAPILKTWKYKVKPRTRGRNFLHEWLDAGIILTPAEAYKNQELAIKQVGSGNRTRKPAGSS